MSGQAVEVIWTAHPDFDGIQSWQPAFVLACEGKGSHEAFKLTALSQLGLGKSWHSVLVQCQPKTWEEFRVEH